MKLAGFIQSLDEADDPDGALLEHVLSEAGRRSPELAAAIRSCAIPRRFDAEILGVLRGTPEDLEGNERLLFELLDYPFVQPRETSGYVYQDSVRRQLLAEWQQSERHPEFEELTWRLVRHHEEAHARARKAEEDAARVSGIIQRANPARFRQLAAALEAGLLAPLIEAIGQLALLSPETALSFLGGHLESYLDRERFSTSRALIAATRDAVTRLPEDEARASVLDWLEFEEGLLLVRVEKPREAERKLVALLASDPGDARLRYWTLGELGQAQRSQFALRDALKTFEEEVALNEETNADPLNLPVSYIRLARTHLVMGRPDVAAVHVAKALAAAEESGDATQLLPSLEVRAQCELELGHRAEAFEVTMRALDVARTELRTRRAPRVALNALLAHYFAGESPEILDTLLAEGEALVAAIDSPLVPPRRQLERIDRFIQSGQLRRARAVAATAEEQGAAGGSDAVRAELLYRQAHLAGLEGRFDEAAGRLTECEAAASRGRRPDLVAYSRRARAKVMARQGRWAEVEQELAALEEIWLGHGHDGFAGLARAERAAAARQRGDAAQAERLLGEAGERLASAGPALRAEYLRALGEHEAARGRLSPARLALAESARLSDAMSSPDTAADARAMLAALTAAQGDREEAVRDALSAAAAWQALADGDVYEPLPESAAGDRYNADGLQMFLSDDPVALASSMERFRAAVDEVPNPWYGLNCGYAAAALGDWGAAVDALAGILHGESPVDCRALRRRLGAFHVARGRALLDGRQHQPAAEAFADSVERLDHPEQEQARAECLLGLGDSLRLTGDLEGSGRAYRQAEAAGYATATLRVGELLAEGGDRNGAIEAFRSSARSGDSEVAAESAIRLIELLEDSPEEVGRAIGLVLETGGPEAALALGHGLAARGRRRAAGQAFEAIEAELSEASVALGDLRREVGDLAGAQAAFERAGAAQDPGVRSEAAVRLGAVLRARGELPRAAEAFRECIGLEDAGPMAWAELQLGEVLTELGSPREAEYQLQRAAAQDDPAASPRALLNLGNLMAESGRSVPAADAWRRALASPDVEVSALAGLRLLDAAGADREEAIEAVLHSGAQTALGLADMLARRGDRTAAQELLRRAAELEDDLYAPDAALRLGELLFEDGDRAQARAFYQRALESEDGTVAPDAALRLIDDAEEPAEATVERVIGFGGLSAVRMGDLLMERGDREHAERAYRKVAALEGDPFAPDAERRLNDESSERS